MKNKSLEKYYFENRKDIVNFIPDNVNEILDLGCGSAVTWKHEKYKVTGVEIFFNVAKYAKKNISNILVANVEYLPIKGKKFDCIVLGDIIEHLINPWNVLKSCRELLSDNGYIIASIPNLQYYKIIRKIIFNKFDYKEYGILDIDHLRFFTLHTIKKLFENSGYKILEINRKLKFKPQYKLLNFIFLNKLQNFFTYQYYILAQKL